MTEPKTELDRQFSSPDASATPWSEAVGRLESAEIFWLSTVRPEGRPHVTPLIAVWFDEALFFCTGPGERKAKNLEANPNVVVTTGSDAIGGGLDIVVEGRAALTTDESLLQRVADTYVSKYGDEWTFVVTDGAFEHRGHQALVFEVKPVTAFGFAKGEFAQTRWSF